MTKTLEISNCFQGLFFAPNYGPQPPVRTQVSVFQLRKMIVGRRRVFDIATTSSAVTIPLIHVGDHQAKTGTRKHVTCPLAR